METALAQPLTSTPSSEDEIIKTNSRNPGNNDNPESPKVLCILNFGKKNIFNVKNGINQELHTMFTNNSLMIY